MYKIMNMSDFFKSMWVFRKEYDDINEAKRAVQKIINNGTAPTCVKIVKEIDFEVYVK